MFIIINSSQGEIARNAAEQLNECSIHAVYIYTSSEGVSGKCMPTAASRLNYSGRIDLCLERVTDKILNYRQAPLSFQNFLTCGQSGKSLLNVYLTSFDIIIVCRLYLLGVFYVCGKNRDRIPIIHSLL